MLLYLRKYRYGIEVSRHIFFDVSFSLYLEALDILKNNAQLPLSLKNKVKVYERLKLQNSYV